METVVGEKIQVVTLFTGSQIKPLFFLWQERIYKVLKVDFSYVKDLGREKIIYFSVSTETGIFELSFKREMFSWNLEKIY